MATDNELREMIIHDIGLLANLVQEGIVTLVENNREAIEALVTDALSHHSRNLDPDEEITDETYKSVANKAYRQALIDTLEFFRSSIQQYDGETS